MQLQSIPKTLSLLLVTSSAISFPLASSANALTAANIAVSNAAITQTQMGTLVSVAPNWKANFPRVKDAISREIAAHLKNFARGNRGDAWVEALEVRGSKIYVRGKVRHHHVWKKPFGGSVTVYSLTHTVEFSFDPLNPDATLDNSRMCFKSPGGDICVSAKDIVRIIVALL